MQIVWTPRLPVVYISNPKAGCSTIKQSLKAAQADDYERRGAGFKRIDQPHGGDDCLRREGLTPAACRERYVISCVRNPFTRALSGYLDKVSPPGAKPLPEFWGRKVDTFEDYLRALSGHKAPYLNPHFRPQHINIDYPRIKYDAIFFLENLPALSRFLTRIYPNFKLETHAPHSRGAADKLRRHYTDEAVDLVRALYARDFELFGYSDRVDDATGAPGEAIAADGHVASDAASCFSPPRATPGSSLATTLRYRRLVDLGLL
jgi:hypothetical protein